MTRSIEDHLRAIDEAGGGIDEPAKAHDPNNPVEIAQCGLDLRQHVYGAGARRLLSVFDRDAGAQSTDCRKLAFTIKAKLARNHQRIPSADERDVVCDRGGAFFQRDAELL